MTNRTNDALLTDDDRFTRWEALVEDGSFEETIEALEESVQRLDDGDLTLEASIQCYELGAKLAQRCTELLNDAELRIEAIDASLLVGSLSDFDDDDVDEDDLE